MNLRSCTFDFLIVGAGLFGATCAYELSKRGFKCIVVDKRHHIGGNCYTEARDGINVHMYGAHIFHTSDRYIWEWICQFCAFNTYRHHLKVNVGGKIFSFPINLFTMHQLWGVTTPDQARARLREVAVPAHGPSNLENWIIAQVGTDIYRMFIEGYTRKQWGKHPRDLPASIIRRLPIRLTYNDAYFDDSFQGIPIGGYTQLFEKLLASATVYLGTDYLANRHHFDRLAKKLIFTGPIDQFFDYRFGELEYRSLRFEHERVLSADFQGVAVMNYSSYAVPFTRIIEHKHFEFGRQEITWITREYPERARVSSDPMYPLADTANRKRYEQYRALSLASQYRDRYCFGGRLGSFQYYDMHQVIAAALKRVDMIASESGNLLHA